MRRAASGVPWRIDRAAYDPWKSGEFVPTLPPCMPLQRLVESLQLVHLDNGTKGRLYEEHPTRMVTFSGLT